MIVNLEIEHLKEELLTYKNTPINNLGPVQRTTYHLCDSHEFHNNEPITTSRISRIFLVPTVLFEEKIILIIKVLLCATFLLEFLFKRHSMEVSSAPITHEVNSATYNDDSIM